MSGEFDYIENQLASDPSPEEAFPNWLAGLIRQGVYEFRSNDPALLLADPKHPERAVRQADVSLREPEAAATSVHLTAPDDQTLTIELELAGDDNVKQKRRITYTAQQITEQIGQQDRVIDGPSEGLGYVQFAWQAINATRPEASAADTTN